MALLSGHSSECATAHGKICRCACHGAGHSTFLPASEAPVKVLAKAPGMKKAVEVTPSKTKLKAKLAQGVVQTPGGGFAKKTSSESQHVTDAGSAVTTSPKSKAKFVQYAHIINMMNDADVSPATKQAFKDSLKKAGGLYSLDKSFLDKHIKAMEKQLGHDNKALVNSGMEAKAGDLIGALLDKAGKPKGDSGLAGLKSKLTGGSKPHESATLDQYAQLGKLLDNALVPPHKRDAFKSKFKQVTFAGIGKDTADSYIKRISDKYGNGGVAGRHAARAEVDKIIEELDKKLAAKKTPGKAPNAPKGPTSIKGPVATGSKTFEGTINALDYNNTSITHEQRKAASSYQGTGYSTLNKALRKGEPLNSYQQQMVTGLDGLHKQSKLANNVEVYRGVRRPTSVFADGWDDAGDATGMEWTDKGYMSTTYHKPTAKTFASKWADGQHKGVVFRIKVPKGTPAYNYGHEWEHELVFKRGMKFRVTADHGYSSTFQARLLDAEVIG